MSRAGGALSFRGAILEADCAAAVAGSPWVSVSAGAAEAFAGRVADDALRPPRWDGDPRFALPSEEAVAAWLLAYNAVNYCYWPESGPRWWTLVDGVACGRDDEALGVMAAFATALRAGVPLGDGGFLRALDAAGLEALLPAAPTAGPLPRMSWRLASLHELGVALQRLGGPVGLIRGAGGSAPGLVDVVVSACPSWRDERRAAGAVLRFHKRAQLLVAMLVGRLGGEGLARLDGVGRLSVFADYRLPQALRHAGVVRVARPLEARIASGALLARASPEEIALRAATVHGAAAIRGALAARHGAVEAWVVDHLLWRSAVAEEAALPAFHRTPTTDY